MDFKTSKTRENLMRAFAGESQARNRYTFAAAAAESSGLHVVARIFRFTAEQEREHAELFFKLLAPCEGENIHIDAGFPVENAAWSTDRLLRSAQHNEYEEARSVYPGFAAVAREEGYGAAASAFERIAKIEQTHGERFGLLAQRIEEGKIFSADGEGACWLCLKCGHVHCGTQVPPVCPVCKHAQGFFVRADAQEILAAL
ncbi:MAG: UBP-type zinc finger domain-containing protein [Clostridia bacterium]|nr:UBP-type zinc finger domain-containing protein [Clostridia bacterium]